MVTCPCSCVCVCVYVGVSVCVCVSANRVCTWPGKMPLNLNHTAVPLSLEEVHPRDQESVWSQGSHVAGKGLLCLSQSLITFLQAGNKVQPVSSPSMMEAGWEDSG